MVMIIDKLPSLKQSVNSNLETQILEQATNLFKNYKVENDKGALLRAGVLGVNLTKIGNTHSQKLFFEQIHSIIKNISLG
jgi:hypothetical protein